LIQLKAGRARIFAVVLALVFVAPQLAGQTTSTIEDTVMDKQGLAVSGAEVRVEGSTAAVTRTVITLSSQ
jgi:hypothetical protein